MSQEASASRICSEWDSAFLTITKPGRSCLADGMALARTHGLPPARDPAQSAPTSSPSAPASPRPPRAEALARPGILSQRASPARALYLSIFRLGMCVWVC